MGLRGDGEGVRRMIGFTPRPTNLDLPPVPMSLPLYSVAVQGFIYTNC